MDEWTGWLGMLLLVVAFIPAAFATVKKGKSELRLAFLVPYIAGVILTLYYSYQLNSMPFVALNMMLFALCVIDIYFGVFPRKGKKKR